MRPQVWIRGVLVRDLGALRRELEAYSDESDIWRQPPGISNSAGNLALHIVGNLQSFVGATLGSTDYVRDRTAEFTQREVPLAEIISEIETTISVVDETLKSLDEDAMSSLFPLSFGDMRVGTGDFLLHLSTHLAFHLGQIDYHRRLITGRDDSIGPLAIAELSSAQATD